MAVRVSPGSTVAPNPSDRCNYRYDVKYGSAGFNGYGYQGGCAFATGQFATALADPEASRFLCLERGLVACHHDFSGVGVCGTVNRLDGFFRVQEARSCPVPLHIPTPTQLPTARREAHSRPALLVNELPPPPSTSPHAAWVVGRICWARSVSSTDA